MYASHNQEPCVVPSPLMTCTSPEEHRASGSTRTATNVSHARRLVALHFLLHVSCHGSFFVFLELGGKIDCSDVSDNYRCSTFTGSSSDDNNTLLALLLRLTYMKEVNRRKLSAADENPHCHLALGGVINEQHKPEGQQWGGFLTGGGSGVDFFRGRIADQMVSP